MDEVTKVFFEDSHTGEIREYPSAGVDVGDAPGDLDDPWEVSPLEQALALVPAIVEAVTRARAHGAHLVVHVSRGLGATANLNRPPRLPTEVFVNDGSCTS